MLTSTSLLIIYSSAGDFSSSLALFGEILYKDVVICNAMMTMYGRFGEIESAKLGFTFSFNRNLWSWNCMISALLQNDNGKRALELLRSRV